MVYFREEFVLDALGPIGVAEEAGEEDAIENSHEGINVGSPDGAKLHCLLEILCGDLCILMADEIGKLFLLLQGAANDRVRLISSRLCPLTVSMGSVCCSHTQHAELKQWAVGLKHNQSKEITVMNKI